MNIIEMLKNQVGGDLPGLISGALGTSPETARSAVNAGIPAMFAGLMNMGSKGDGAQRLSSAVESADESVLGSLHGMLSNPAGSKKLMEGGTNILSSLFGGNTVSGLSAALGRFTGLGAGSGGSLLAMLAPMVLGFLKGQKQQMGLDAGGLRDLLVDQKTNIASAMPSGLGSLLSGVPGMESLGWLKGAAGSAVDSTARAGRAIAGQATEGAHAAAMAGNSAVRWAVPIAAILLVAALIWYFVGRGTPAVSPRAATAVPGMVTDKVSQVARLTTDSTDVLNSATGTLTGITDGDSANAALPKLQDLSGRLDSLTRSVENLPADSRARIGGMFKDALDTVAPLVDKAAAIPGIGDNVQQVLSAVLEKMRALSRLAM
jgi:hypothetical protein